MSGLKWFKEKGRTTGSHKRVLILLMKNPNQWLTKNEIIKHTGLKERTVSHALAKVGRHPEVEYKRNGYKYVPPEE